MINKINKSNPIVLTSRCLFNKYRMSLTSTNKRTTTDSENESNVGIHFESENKDLSEFPHPFVVGEVFDGNGLKPKTLVELSMMQLSGAIRSKENWFHKINDQSIVQKWKEEALKENRLNQKQIDYVFDELKYYDSIRDGSIEMSSVDEVWQSDHLIPNDLKQSLMDYVQIFENIPDKDKDWHPNTNNQVLDLIHPSLFPYVNQITRIHNQFIHVDDCLQSIGKGQPFDLYQNIDKTNKRYGIDSNYTKSKSYQWLPAEFNISKDGKVKIESYINNLHPIQHKQFYSIIEQIFECFIPLFNKLLTNLISIRTKQNRISVDPYNWYDGSNEPNNDDENNEDFDEIYQNYIENRSIQIPDVDSFQMPKLDDKPTIDLKGRKLQVIVKLANIILTPSNPKYEGGVWHIEGMENEHIVASGIYYYHSSNISESNLEFRTTVSEPDYEQNDDRGVRIVYGLNNDGPLNQHIGQIQTKQDRSIVFPNIYQHRVSPFQLKDQNEIGQRKILVFFLVDPSIRILSTANVPPQQSHWLTQLIRSMSPFNQLPSVVLEKILSYVDFPMDIKQAKLHRDKLMFERKFFVQQNNEFFFERPFSLCEH